MARHVIWLLGQATATPSATVSVSDVVGEVHVTNEVLMILFGFAVGVFLLWRAVND